jgi:hypothetical protein
MCDLRARSGSPSLYLLYGRKDLRGKPGLSVWVGDGAIVTKEMPGRSLLLLARNLNRLLFSPLIGVLDLAGPANEHLLFWATQTVSGNA